MNEVSIKVVAQEGAAIPEYKTLGAAGADVCALVDSPVELNPGDRALIGTGLFFAIPDGYVVKEIQVLDDMCTPRFAAMEPERVTIQEATLTLAKYACASVFSILFCPCPHR